MKHNLIFILPVFIIHLSAINGLKAQAWHLVKEKEGIKIYTRHEPNSSLKSFKGETTLNVPIDKVSLLLMNPNKVEWWDKKITQIRVLDYKENKYVQYYLVYDLPWPLVDRDIVVQGGLSIDTVSGDRTAITKILLNTIPVKPNLVRINKYWQKWTLHPIDKHNVHIVLEGFVDPGGNVPAWLYNLLITETPLRTIQSLRKWALSGKL